MGQGREGNENEEATVICKKAFNYDWKSFTIIVIGICKSFINKVYAQHYMSIFC